jgi:hypothetical protein
MVGSPNPSATGYESLFHASSLDLVVPEIGSLPAQPDDAASLSGWWESVQGVRARDVAFFGELDAESIVYVH